MLFAEDWGRRTLVMGVLNVTPDSFSDGGLFFDPAQAVAQAHRMAADGAHLLDIGGESTRPATFGDNSPLPADEEKRRVLPVLARLAAELPHLPCPSTPTSPTSPRPPWTPGPPL